MEISLGLIKNEIYFLVMQMDHIILFKARGCTVFEGSVLLEAISLLLGCSWRWVGPLFSNFFKIDEALFLLYFWNLLATKENSKLTSNPSLCSFFSLNLSLMINSSPCKNTSFQKSFAWCKQRLIVIL